MIVDGVLNQQNGAIPVNEIPEGSLLKVGTGNYFASGVAKSEKSFLGYAGLDSYIGTPQIPEAALAFSSEFIRAGQQYVNVSEFFTAFSILEDITESEQTKLKVVVDSSMMSDDTTKYSVDAKGNRTLLVQGSDTAQQYRFAPVEFKFGGGLYAFETSVEGESIRRFTLCDTAETATGGVFKGIPFFADSEPLESLSSRPVEYLAIGFTRYEGADALRQQLQVEHDDVFAKNLLNLGRMLLFIVLIWLVIASWMCYAARINNLIPILESIRYPTGDRQRKGLDLMKLVSLGTIDLDTDFNLGRFIQYNLILAALLCVVMLTGRITLGG